MAIRIEVERASEGYDLLSSKFLGEPVLPLGMLDTLPDEAVFFCQIRLSDIADYDVEGVLPRRGYLYVFLDTEVYPPTVCTEYYDGEPRVVVDDFNATVPTYSHLTTPYLMRFSPCADDYDGTRLFGSTITDIDDDGTLILTYDSLDNDMGLYSDIDGYLYFLLDTEDIRDIRLVIDRS